MQIDSYMGYDRLSYLSSIKAKSSASFQELMQRTSVTVKTVSDSDGNIGYYGVSRSPVWDEYDKWRENREPVHIPNTDGWTEENIQYLKDRYRGELSVFERIEALQIMANMGCITPEEYQEALGTKMTICKANEATCVTGRLEEGGYSRYPWLGALSEINWAEALKTLPICKVNTLDELLDLLNENGKFGVSGK